MANISDKILFNNLRKVLEEYGVALVNHCKNNLTFLNKNASGKLRDSITYVIEEENNSIELSLSLLDYWKYVDEGRRAGRFPQINKIEEWIKIKPIIPRANLQGKLPTIKQLTFLISRKIAEDGTKASNFESKAEEMTYKEFEKNIEIAMVEDLQGKLDKITYNIFKY